MSYIGCSQRCIAYVSFIEMTSSTRGPREVLGSSCTAHMTFCVAADRLPAQIVKLGGTGGTLGDIATTDNMASVLNSESDAYVDIEGHRVRNYDLKLAKIPRLDYKDPQVELMIANEVS